MTFRRTFQWLVMLVLLAATGGGAFAWRLWDQRDLLLEATLKEKLPEFFPGWNVTLGRVRFDWYRRIQVKDVALLLGEPAQPAISIPELLITVDRRELTQNQRIVVQKIRLVGATVDVVRTADGKWNWLNLPPIKRQETGCPEFEIERGTLRLRFEPSDGSRPTLMTFRQVELKLIPAGRRAYIAKGGMHIHQMGPLAFEGRFDVETKTWSVDGRLKDVVTNGDLFKLAAGFSPEFRQNLNRVGSALDKVRVALGTDPAAEPRHAVAWTSGHANPPVVLANSSREREPTDGLPDFGVTALMDIGFHADQRAVDSPPDFRLNVGLRQGRVQNDLLPFLIENMEADVYWDRQNIEIRRLTGSNGLTRLAFGGKVERVEGTAPGAFGVRIENLMLDEELQKRLPPAARKIYDSLNPSGPIDVECAVEYDGISKWTPHSLLVTANRCRVAHAKFPYRVTDVIGTVTQDGTDLKCLFEGRAGDRPVLLQGTIHNPGPAAEMAFEITAKQIPLDETFLAACPANVQAPLASLNIRGYADGDVRIYRPPGIGQKSQVQIAGRVTRGTFEYEKFPLRLTNFTGRLGFNSVDELWTFDEMKAEHGRARVTGSGSFTRVEKPGRLALTINATDLPLDQSLELALPETLRKLWDDLAPAGTLKSVETKIDWVPGEKPEITLPSLQITKGSIMPKAFPYFIDQVESTGSWSQGRLDITSFTGRHDDTPLSAEGFCETSPDGEWRLRFQNASAQNLIMDRSFRAALPPKMLSILESADPQGSVSLTGALELRGTGVTGDAMTAWWKGEAEFPGNILNAGLTLKNVRGKVTSEGTWDGRLSDMAGRFDLETVTVLDHHIQKVKGPYRFRDKHLLLGSAEAMVPERRPDEKRKIPDADRIVGKAIGGDLILDASAVFNEVPSWAAKAILNDGHLEEYAALYAPRTKNVRGVMKGWIDLHGRGSSTANMTGHGALQISPAALYELPLMVQMFSAVSVTPQDRTAFRYAYTDFTIQKNSFHFGVIDLIGDAISFRGSGTAGFNGELNLDFYSMVPKRKVVIPVVDFIRGELGKGWVKVEVRGRTSAPVARMKAMPQVDEALKKFLGAFNPMQAAPIQQLPSVPTFREN
ncbi:MAG: hypothetical protein IT428_10390 [Planctomycetaceae bacterium]|nr:hypothetical protein [Planctomycetaceae bacterium]